MSWALYTILAVPLAATALTLLDGWRGIGASDGDGQAGGGPARAATPVSGPARIATPWMARAATLVSGLASLALAVVLAIAVAHGRVLDAAGGWLRLDSLGAVFLLATGLLYAMAAVFSIGYLRVEQERTGFAGFAKRYHALLNLFGWSMLLVALAADFGTLWVAIELTTIVSALLVAIDRTDAALEASWKYVLIASSGLGIALLSIVVLYATGTHALGGAYLPRFERFLAHAHGLSPDAVRLAFALALVGFGTKVGFVPMYTWLPDAHSEAPAPVSAMLSGSLLAGALYAILRFFQVAVAAGERSFAEHALIVFGVVSLVAASFFVLRQGNYKRLLAYSSIEHMGIIALGIGFGAPLAVAGALLHVITHASAKGLAFFGAGSLLRGYDTKEVDGVRNAGKAMPWTGPMFLAAALALCGLPLSGVFRSEFQIVVGGFASAQYVGVTLLLVFVNLAFFGIVWHTGQMVLGSEAQPAVGSAPAPTGESSAWMVAAMLGCLFVLVALGVHLPGELTALLANASHRLAVPA
jgi:hydrogenase-4 component F